MIGITAITFNVGISTGEVIKAIREGESYEVEITDSGFNPERLYVQLGDRITWINYAEYPQTVTSKYWGSELLGYGDTYSIVMDLDYPIDYFSLVNETFRGEIVPL